MTQNFDEGGARREYQQSPGLQAEFGALDVYLAYERGLSAGRIRPPITSRTVTAEPAPRREADEQVSPPVQRFTSSAAPKRQRQALESRDAAKRQALESRDAAKRQALESRDAAKRQALESRDAAKRQASPDLRAIWDQHGPQSGRIQCAATMQRFRSFEEFEKHVASHSREVTTHGR